MIRTRFRTALAAAVATVAISTAPSMAATDASSIDAKQIIVPDAGKTVSGNYLAGRFAQARRDVVAAASFLGYALKRAPEAPDLLRRTFLMAMMAGDVDRAADLARRLIKGQDQVPLANLTLAAEALRNHDWAAVDKVLAPLPDTGLNTFTKPLFLAWAKAGAGDHDGALAALSPLTKTRGAGVLHDLHAALIHEQAGRFDEAVKLFVKVTESQQSPSLRVTQLLGNLYQRMGEADKARALFNMYGDDNPNSTHTRFLAARVKSGIQPPVMVASATDGAAEALFGLAGSLQRQNLRDTALVLGRLSLHLKPDYPIMQYMVGGILEAEDRPTEALAVYQSIPKETSFGWSARLRTSDVLDAEGRTDEAIAVLKAMAAERPDDPAPHVSLGDRYRGREDWENALAAYDAAVKVMGELQPHHWRLLYSRGIAAERAKQWPRAEADFKQALLFQPDQPFVLNYLGYSWIEQGLNLDEAQAMIVKAVAARPRDGYIVDSLGWGYYKLGEYEKAVKELERAVELRPHDPIINDHLGDALWRVGRKREARFQWNHALERKPDDTLRAELKDKLANGLPPAKPIKSAN